MGHTNTPTRPVTSCEIKESYSDGTQLVKFVPYASATEAGRKTGISQANITNCCLKKLPSTGGFFWFFTKDNHPPKIRLVGTIRVPRIGDKPRPYRRKLFSESPTGEKQLHEGACAAKRTLSECTGKKFNHAHISACCLGNRKHHQKYKFCFASEKEVEDFEKQQKEAASNKRKRDE